MRTLTYEQARKFYDRLGSRQDSQAFYEDRATSLLIENAELQSARSVVEFGCGTGRFAEKLLSRHLPGDASYLGIDASTTMAALASERLARFGERARVRQSNGSPAIDAEAGSVDRVVSTYVLDLLSHEDIQAVIDEAHRVLASSGLLGLVGLTPGFTALSRFVVGTWSAIHRLSPSLVGGCRPVDLGPFIDSTRWNLRYHERVAPFGMPSEILVVQKQD